MSLQRFMNYADHVRSTYGQVLTTFTIPAGMHPTTQWFVSPTSVQGVAKYIRCATTARFTYHGTTTIDLLSHYELRAIYEPGISRTFHK
jgi:hypothetical protein